MTTISSSSSSQPLQSLPLPSLFTKGLETASKASNLPTADNQTQELIRSSLQSLHLLQSRISGLSLFSPNETLEDISTRDLIYLLVPFVSAQVQDRVRISDPGERVGILERVQNHFKSFLLHLESYDIVPEDEVALYSSGSGAGIQNPASRRELKIKQYQKEKDLRARIETIRKRRNQRSVSDSPPNDFNLIASLLPSPKSSHPSSNVDDLDEEDDDEDDSDTSDVIRSTILLLLRLFYAQAQTQLGSIEQEMELLRNVPLPPSRPTQGSSEQENRNGKKDGDNDMWKLDAPKRGGPLLDPKGKPLQPFTILPSGSTSTTSDRTRLQAQVFRPDHNLPTMSIDEYLEIEQARGKFIQGGGPASENAPTSKEVLAMQAEEDGTAEGETKEEERRVKDESWARYTDENPRGAGNTMNRG
ncbi:hypothetical protein GYMLUDRAFT_45498 [Collybiopsis luxurians FD-317 M1]|uniref:TAP42-like protein n=1 Tax=Collybiopsis luxurians FD-317 M1 TaxID=944289 RepID=A0A0D0B4P1_9AGAR|nr:hypothetical protein GYMLUDRAFT_45498 [Collybiopsis luxurians FD-317 M1]